MIEILPVGVTVDHASGELELLHAALELVGRGFGILHRQVAEAGIAIRPLLDLAGEEIIAGACDLDRGGGVALGLHAGPGDREHRARNAGAVHGFQPELAEVGEPRHHLLEDRRIDVADGRLPVLFEAGTQEVLFQRDLRNHSFLVRFLVAPCTVLWSGCTRVRNT
jgi:hypothetical protein